MSGIIKTQVLKTVVTVELSAEELERLVKDTIMRQLDEQQMFNRAIKPDEVQAEFDCGSSGYMRGATVIVRQTEEVAE